MKEMDTKKVLCSFIPVEEERKNGRKGAVLGLCTAAVLTTDKGRKHSKDSDLGLLVPGVLFISALALSLEAGCKKL